MKRVLRSYLFWTYDRGSFHYDVMVTLILLFIFVSPHVLRFGDKPVYPLPIRSHDVLVRASGANCSAQEFVYEVRTEDLGSAHTDAQLRSALLQVIEPIAGGGVTLRRYTPVTDAHGQTVAYDATIER